MKIHSSIEKSSIHEVLTRLSKVLNFFIISNVAWVAMFVDESKPM
jgi:hypothetical protein